MKVTKATSEEVKTEREVLSLTFTDKGVSFSKNVESSRDFWVILAGFKTLKDDHLYLGGFFQSLFEGLIATDILHYDENVAERVKRIKEELEKNRKNGQ